MNDPNETVLYVGLDEGSARVVVREGDVLAPGLTLKTILSVDGNGTTVFFLATVAGPSVKKNDVALCAVLPDSTIRILAREGDLVAGRPVTVLATLLECPAHWQRGAGGSGLPRSELD